MATDIPTLFGYAMLLLAACPLVALLRGPLERGATAYLESREVDGWGATPPTPPGAPP